MLFVRTAIQYNKQSNSNSFRINGLRRYFVVKVSPRNVILQAYYPYRIRREYMLKNFWYGWNKNCPFLSPKAKLLN